MDFSRSNQADRARLALELTMRDALDGLEELASLDVYWFEPGCLEILSIERPVPVKPNVTPLRQPSTPANILTFPEKRCCVG